MLSPAMKLRQLWSIGLISTMLLLSQQVVAIPYYWVGLSSSDWSDAGNWSLTSGGAGGAGVPGPGDEAIFDDQGLVVCKLDANITLETLTMNAGYTGTLEFEAFTLTTTNWYANQATLQNGILTLAGGIVDVKDGIMNVELSGTSAHATVIATVFSLPVTLVLADAIKSQFTSNQFQAAVSLAREGVGDLILESNTLNAATELINDNNTGLISSEGTEVYTGALELTNLATSTIDMNYTGTATFSSQVTVHNSTSGTIRFGAGGGSSEVSFSGTVEFFDSGMGTYAFNNMTVNGTFDNNNEMLTGSSILHFTQCTFNNYGVYLIVAQITCGSGNQFNAPFGIQITGTGPSTLSGTFQFNVMIDHPGTGTLTLQNNTFNNFANLTNWLGGGPIIAQGTEVYNSNFYVNNQSIEPIDLAYTGTTTYTSLVNLHNGTSGTIRFGAGGGSSEVSFSGTVEFFDSGMGTYAFNNMTVNGTFDNNNEMLTGSSILHFTQCTFNNYGVYLIVAQITCGSGNQFNAPFGIQITGTGPSTLSGTFQFNVMIDHPGTGTLTLQNNTFNNFANLTNWLGGGPIIAQGTEVYNSNFYVNNQSIEPIDLAYTGTTTYTSLVNLHNGTSGTIRFGAGGGSSEVSFSGTVEFFDSGMGTYAFNNMTVNGTFDNNDTALTGSSVLSLTQCTINSYFGMTTAHITCGSGNVFTAAFALMVTGTGASNLTGTFQQQAVIQRTGSGTLTLQSNTFHDEVDLTNWNGTGSIITQGNETYHGIFDVVNLASAPIQLANTGTTTYDGNITLNNATSGSIHLGTGGGLATLTSGNTFAINDSGAGLYSLLGFTQQGPTPITLALTGTAQLALQQCEFDAPLTISSGSSHANALAFTQNIFHETVGLSYTGTGNATGGGNLFEDVVTVSNGGSGTFTLGSGSGDTYQQAATFTRTLGTLQPCLNNTCTFEDDLTIHTGTGAQLVVGTSASQGIVRFTGSTPSYTTTGTLPPHLYAVVVDLTAGTLHLNGTLAILADLTLTNGTITGSPTSPVRILNDATITGANATRFVDGPVSKVGNQAFTFPVGAGSVYRPIAISAPGAVTDEFTARFFNVAQAYGTGATYTAPLMTVSACEYWTLDRTAGTASVFVTVGWTSADCPGSYVMDPTTLVVARWNGTNWVSHGQNGYTGTAVSGTVTSQNALAAFSPIAVGSTTLSNPLPIELVHFRVHTRELDVLLQWESLTEVNSDYYAVQRSASGDEFESRGQVLAAGTSLVRKEYSYVDHEPLSLAYYRLKMVDRDGTTTYSKVVRVERTPVFSVYPNPVSETISFTVPRRVRIYSITGTMVLDSEVPVRTLELSESLAAGSYWIITEQGERKAVIVVR